MRANDNAISIPALMKGLKVTVRATGARRAIWRLHLMRWVMVLACKVGGVHSITLDLSTDDGQAESPGDEVVEELHVHADRTVFTKMH